jgi:hypothetical protein
MGKTGAVGLCAGAGITFSLDGNTYAFRLDYLKGAAAFTSEDPTGADHIIYQKKPSGLTAEMRLTTIGKILSLPYETAPLTVTSSSGSQFLLVGSGDSTQKAMSPTNVKNEILSDAITSFNGRTGSVQGVCSANGLTGAVTFHVGQGITVSTTGSGISFAINYQHGGASLDIKAYSPGGTDNPAGVDFLLAQRKNTGGSGEMYLMSIINMFNQFGPQVSIPKYGGVLGEGLVAPFVVQVDGSAPIAVDFDAQVDVISKNLTTVDGGTFA